MSTKSKMVLWYAVSLAIFGGGSFAAFHFGHSTLGTLVLIVPVALIANGFLAEHEDNAPGGFNNPNTKPADEASKNEERA